MADFRYWLEAVAPELRQYIVTNNVEERPFSRDQRRWVYASAKSENSYFGFGSDNELEQTPGYLIVKHSAFPLEAPGPGYFDYGIDYGTPCVKVLGVRPRPQPDSFRPASIVSVSAVELRWTECAAAIDSLDCGAAMAA